MPFDLGCHWMHSASLNPLVALPDRLGVAFARTEDAIFPDPRQRQIHLGTRWASAAEHREAAAFFARGFAAAEAAGRQGRDLALSSLTEREKGRLAVAPLGGRHGAGLERAGPAAMVDLAMAALAKVFGSGIADELVRSTCSAWGGDGFVRGAYSGAKPGNGAGRAALARPIDGHLFFAGEATSIDAFATCHGAYLSGIAAAREVAARLAPGAEGPDRAPAPTPPRPEGLQRP